MLWTKVNACGLVEIILILLMLLPHIIHPHQLFPCGELQGKFLNLLLFLTINYAQLWSSIILFFLLCIIQLYRGTSTLQSLCCLFSASCGNDFTFSRTRSNCLCSCSGTSELCYISHLGFELNLRKVKYYFLIKFDTGHWIAPLCAHHLYFFVLTVM